MPTLHELTGGTSTISFTFGSVPVRVTYYPGLITETFIGQVLAINNMDETTFMSTFKSFNATFCEVIESWDITENDGTTMFPLDPEHIAKLPIQLRGRIASEIMSDMRPNEGAPKILN